MPKIPQKKEGVFRILAFNPGSTSTKFGIYDNEECIFIETVRHDAAKLAAYGSIPAQKEFRRDGMLKSLAEAGLDLKTLDAVAGRGGIIKPIPSGVYPINERMLEDLHSSGAALHATCLGGIIASEIAGPLGIPCYIVDPVVVYEKDPVTVLSGLPEIERRSVFHALNQKAISRRFAADQGKSYEELRLVVAHLGGGISVGAHRYGKVVDVNDALHGEGPFSPERSGTLPTGQLVNLCFSGKYSKDEVKKMLVGKGGYVGYFGSNDAYRVEKNAQAGDEKSILIQNAMAYQVAKAIGEAAVVLKGKIDAILLTGGIAFGKPIVAEITRYIDWIAPVKVYPGEDEMRALAFNAYLILTGEAVEKIYE